MVGLRFLLAVCCLVLASPGVGWGEPPAHAPAHGYRNKHKHEHQHREKVGGFEIVFDSERGVHVVIGFPGILVHDGRFFRRAGGGWQRSTRPDGGWSVVAVGRVPSLVRKAHFHAAPAKLEVEHSK